MFAAGTEPRLKARAFSVYLPGVSEMWPTPGGERVLRPCEWNLFREGLSLLWDQVEDSMDEPELCFTGVRVFDQLDPKTKLAMLAFVAIRSATSREPALN